MTDRAAALLKQHRVGQSPAQVVIAAFNSASRLADMLGLNRSTVGRWDWPAEKRGTGGKIPSKYHQRILELAKANDVPLTPQEIIFGRAA